MKTHPKIKPTSPTVPVARQMSFTGAVGGRGRSASAARRAHVHAQRADVDTFLRRWSMLMITSFATAEAIGAHFDVTKQTGCNWREGTHRPSGDAVDHAMQTLPLYSQIMWGK
ncbi:hypothetical protein [Paracoccus laeviglucosivorans]|uniref:Uncharacterized protein n=1 Tax=Paracoccus laeviglucosivorans TaxID=1197861 RepID=A0A521CWU9_9RHOB|nr:hypothetical protein [Paracoccus laeviglucosivorans]SMO63929.1 hypothetical protein SAMN06265221_105227 [Paracoccus laeviglucosivorans]